MDSLENFSLSLQYQILDTYNRIMDYALYKIFIVLISDLDFICNVLSEHYNNLLLSIS